MRWRYLWKALVLLWAACCATSLHLREEDDGSGSGSGSKNGTDGGSPPLSHEAIANISASGLALLVMGSALCYLLMCFNREERMQRVRMAQERNRQITNQMEAAKQRRRAQQAQPVGAHGSLQSPIPGGRGGEGEEEKAVGALLFSQVHRSMEAEGDASHEKGTSPPYEPLVSSVDNS